MRSSNHEAEIPWDEIRSEYLAGGVSYRKLAQRYDITAAAIQRRGTGEHWQDMRERVRIKTESQVVQSIAGQQTERFIKLYDVVEQMQDRLL